MTITRPVPQIGSLHGSPIEGWAESFWGKVDQSGDCWLWTKSLSGGGYGRLAKWRSPTVLAHRLSWMIHFGEIPDGLKVLHTCDVRPCVRPEHLFLGTTADNQRDASNKRRLCHRITPEVAQQMLELRDSGMSIRAVAERTGISVRHTHLVLKGTHRFSKEAA